MPKGEQHRLNVRLSEQEHAALARRAKDCGLSMSGYVKARCLGDDTRPKVVVDHDVLLALYRDQRRIGGLLNQLLGHANSRRQDFPMLTRDAESLLGDLRNVTQGTGELVARVRDSA